MAYEYGAGGSGCLPADALDDALDYPYGLTLEEWARDKPLSILQLDPADRAVLRIAGRCPDSLWPQWPSLYPSQSCRS